MSSPHEVVAKVRAESPRLANQACQQCSRSKRKCSRELPACSVCIRLARNCKYPASRKPYTHSQPEAGKVTSAKPNPFPDAFFLDPDFLEPLPASALKSTCAVPAEIALLLDDNVTLICERYFASIDTWFPIISRKRLNQDIENDPPSSNAGSALLLLCMKLSTESPADGPSTPAGSATYRAAKDFLNAMEEMAPLCLSVLQSLVLIALYEIGQAMFPAAYLSVGRAARLGLLMGLHDRKSGTQLLQTPSTWTQWEEQRRTWWATSILERYINLSPTGRPLATPEPSQGDLLPTTDAEWSRGAIGATHAVYSHGFSSNSQIGPFARTCQASHILGRVLNHRNVSKTAANKEALLNEALQLDATLTALDKHLAREEGDGSSGTVVDVALCTSARVALYQMYACNLPEVVTERLEEESELQSASIEGVKQIIGVRARALAKNVLQQGAVDINTLSPLVIKCLYETASECQWLVREGNIVEEAEETMGLLMEALTLLAKRWIVADKCLELLKRSDVA